MAAGGRVDAEALPWHDTARYSIMTTIELHEERHRGVVTAALITAPALLFAGNALHPVNHSRDEQEWLAGIAEHRPQWYAAHLLVFASLPLFVPAIAGLLRALSGRRSALSDAGALVAVIAAFGTAGFVAVEGFATWQMTAAGADRAPMVALMERFNDEAGTFVPTGLATFVFSIALGVVGVALMRERVEPRWAPVVIVASRVVATAAFAIGHEVGEYPMAIVAVADLLLLVGFGGLALRRGAASTSA